MSDEEVYMFAERYAHFSNAHTIYRDLISGHYKPSVDTAKEGEWEITNVKTTAMFLLYAYFYSMIEDDPKGVNGFRVWRAKWPEEENAIVAVESLVSPLLPGLKLFRNRMGFHGSRSRTHEQKGLDFFAQHSGTAVWEAMLRFKSLGAALFRKDLEKQGRAESGTARKLIDQIEAKCKTTAP